MEFFFLTENNSAEIQLLLLLAIILITILSHNLYKWIGRVWEALKTPQRGHPHKTLAQVVHSVPPISLPETDTVQIPNSQVLILSEKIDTSKNEKLIGLVSSARTLIARGMTSEAQTLIVEGLSLSKNHRELNLLLAQIYEQDGQYASAEYIYKDMAEHHSTDIEILEKLANVLIVEKKYLIASEIYKKIYAFTGNTESTLYMLTHISNTLGDNESTLQYAKQYVLQWPKNPEILTLLASTQANLGLRRNAIETYRNLKNITPYSSEITQILHKLLLEEELANNFEVKES